MPWLAQQRKMLHRPILDTEQGTLRLERGISQQIYKITVATDQTI